MADAEGGDADDEGNGQYGHGLGLAEAQGSDAEDDGDGQYGYGLGLAEAQGGDVDDDGDGAFILERPISIQEPWWVREREMSKTTGTVCRAIGKKADNMEGCTIASSDKELEQNVNEMQLFLNKLMIKRTATSRTIDGDQVLVKLPPNETKKGIRG